MRSASCNDSLAPEAMRSLSFNTTQAVQKQRMHSKCVRRLYDERAGKDHSKKGTVIHNRMEWSPITRQQRKRQNVLQLGKSVQNKQA
eukprot:m.59130 g.59130  ORF g.59130 m.59130 type:complete len:87 (+) comp11750_c0_seq3:1703-1963(+)